MEGTSLKLFNAAAGAGGGPYSFADPKLDNHDPDFLNISFDEHQHQPGAIYQRLEEPDALCFKPDGTKLFVYNHDNPWIIEYSLSIPWEIGSATWVNANHIPSAAVYSHGSTHSTNTTSALGFHIKDDGTKVYIFSALYPGWFVDELTLSTPWDITTATHTHQYANTSIPNYTQGANMSPDGSHCYILTSNSHHHPTCYHYTLSTAGDFSSTVTQTSTKVLTGNSSTNTYWTRYPEKLSFSTNGQYVYYGSRAYEGPLFQWEMSTPWNIGTATFFTEPRAPHANQWMDGNIQAGHRSHVWKPDGTKFFHAGNPGSSLVAYDCSTPWDITTLNRGGDGGYMFRRKQGVGPMSDNTPWRFSGGGTHVCWVQYHAYNFAGNYNRNMLFMLPLTTAYDISTADWPNLVEYDLDNNFNWSYSASLYINQVVWNPTGTRIFLMYDWGSSVGQGVRSYDMATAWDPASSKSNPVDVTWTGLGGNDVRDWHFSKDGTKMWVMGYVYASSGNNFRMYTLSTAWDISTAVLDYGHTYYGASSNAIDTKLSYPYDIVFNHDGTLAVSRCGGSVQNQSTFISMDLTTPWDIRTGVTKNEEWIIEPSTGYEPQAFDFNDDGTKFIYNHSYQGRYFAQWSL